MSAHEPITLDTPVALRARDSQPLSSGKPRGEAYRRSAAFAIECWARWPRVEDWPDNLDLCEAAAYKRINYTTLWHACQTGRDGRAALRHQRFGAKRIFRKRDLDAFGEVADRRQASACVAA